MAPAVLVNPNEFKGYPVELLRGLKGMGPALVGDDVLYAAAKAYNDASSPDGSGSALGPALTTADCTTVIQSVTARSVPDTVQPAPVADEVEGDTTWDDHDLDSLVALCEKHGVEIKGRVRTPGKLIAALEAAGITP